MAEAVYVLGGGGHGRVVLDVLFRSQVLVKGVIDPGLENGTEVLGVPVVGGDEYLDSLSVTEVFLANGLGANPKIATRQQIFTTLKSRGFRFLTLVHPSAIIGTAAEIGEGSQLMAGAVVQCGVALGANVVINTRASIDHDCVIGTQSFIGPGAVLCGDVIVEESVFLGAGAIVLPGIRIGCNAIVGAGAVVKKTVPSGWIVYGNPAIKMPINE